MDCVELDWWEFAAALNAARDRFVNSRVARLEQASSVCRSWTDAFADELVGAIAEQAFAARYGIYFVPRHGDYHRAPDFQPNIEIRAANANRRRVSRLIHRGNDSPDRVYVFALVDAPRVTFAGWVWGHECRRPEFESNPGGSRAAWFVPVTALRSMDDWESRGNAEGY